MTLYDEEYDQFEISPDTELVDFKKLKLNDYIILNSKPCKIVSMVNTSIGKFGKAEKLISGVDIFEGNKLQQNFPNDEKILVPIVKTSVYQIISIDTDRSLTLQNIQGNTKADLKLPFSTQSDVLMCQKISESFSAGKEILVTAIYSMGVEKVVDFKIL